MVGYKVIQGNCVNLLKKRQIKEVVDLTFLDPPFNQNKNYDSWNDNLPDKEYWQFMTDVCRGVYQITSEGGAVYFMQREKNTEFVLNCMRETGWTLQNLIIWKKLTSAVPCVNKFSKQYQIIAFAIKGKRPRVFNRLRINPPLPFNYKYERENGVFVSDTWDDIRELTAGYLAGEEAIRKQNGERFHKQQSPLSLLLRIILSSTRIGDKVFDPFAGTGTALVVAEQLGRKSIGIELGLPNVECIKNRLKHIKATDNIQKFYQDYLCTKNLKDIWDIDFILSLPNKTEATIKLF